MITIFVFAPKKSEIHVVYLIIMSNTGLEEKVENMNVDEKEPKHQKEGKGGEKAKGEKKKKEDHSGFPLEVSFFTRECLRVTPLWFIDFRFWRFI